MDSEASGRTAFNPSSKFLLGGEYEAFLSFRGPDIRRTFTDFLYTKLNDAGIRTFLDNTELPRGEDIGSELLKAITESKISIPIFSKSYASSKWCLRELAKMVECKRDSSQLILPIFYDVEPFEVRHHSKSYEEAFRKHEIDFDESTVKEWKEALKEVGALKGWEVKNEADGHQGKLVKMVVQTVLLELKKNCTDLTNNLVGIDDHVNEMKRLLKVDSNDIRIVGIYGMGGIGKTTIAKFIYNEFVKCFECCSFLADIRETAQQKGLVSLQKQLLSTLKSCRDIVDHIVDVDSGINIIKERFLKKRVLIVLDDLKEKFHFDCLVGSPNFFGPGSRIIVTTRDEHILNILGVEATYEPTFMNSEQSLQLFNMHAFRNKLPQNGFNDISRMVASTTGGLPLALEVIGSFLSDKPKEVWEETLKKLEKIPHNQVQKKLRISYEELEFEHKQIFLDIACVFIGMDKTYAFYMWKDCHYYPETGLNVLCLLSLVKMGDDNVLRMHDQLRDLGREIVHQEDLRNPGARSRLWDQEEALGVLKDCGGTEKVEVLNLNLKKMEMPVTCKELTKLFNLRYLEIYGGKLVGDFKHHMSKLRWLRWHDCPRRFQATHFHSKNLVILELYDSSITEDWKGWRQIKMTNKLKVLHLAGCDLRRTPDFSPYPSLEILILKKCWKLVKIDPSIGNLKSLRVLGISSTRIRRLPDEVCLLEKLEVIDVTWCIDLCNIPSGIGRLSSLRQLRLSCTKIQSIPTSICALSCLQTLEFESNSLMLKALPDLPSSLEILKVHIGSKNLRITPNISNLVNLQELECRCLRGDVEFPRHSKLQVLMLSCTDISILPKGIGALSRLKILTVESCDDLQCILGLPSCLVELTLDHCGSLERLPDLSNLKKMLKLRLRSCHKLMEIQGLPSSLVKLTLACCESLERLPDLSNLKKMLSLRLVSCHKLMEIQGLPSSLVKLTLACCESLERLPDLSNLKKMLSLRLVSCYELMEIQGLPSSLVELTLECCTSLKRLPDLSNLKKMLELRIASCYGLMEIQGLPSSLVELILECCFSLKRLPDLSNLLELRIEKNNNLIEIQGLPSSLVELTLEDCERLERLPDLSNLKKMLNLSLGSCHKLMEIEVPGELESLTSLYIYYCRTLEEVKILGKLKSVAGLYISCSNMVREVQGLENLESLTNLSLWGCTKLNKIQGLDRLVSLKDLSLRGCTNLNNIQGLDRLVSLEDLDLRSCESIVSLPNLSNLKMLRSLQLRHCTRLREIEGLEALEALELLDIRWCTSLERVPHLPNTNILRTLTRQNSGCGWRLYEIFRS